jgi:hypothetical protein
MEKLLLLLLFSYSILSFFDGIIFLIIDKEINSVLVRLIPGLFGLLVFSILLIKIDCPWHFFVFISILCCLFQIVKLRKINNSRFWIYYDLLFLVIAIVYISFF